VKKFLPYMGAAIATLAMTWSVQAKAQDMFKDVPSDHWAYSAISDLQQKKILLGYPNGYFQGKRVLTRYEFAVALKRALDAIPNGKNGADGKDGAAGKDGTNGQDGAPGKDGAPGMTPEQVTALMKLADTFKAELATLGADVKKINTKLDALSKQVDALNTKIDKMVTFTGDFFTGYSSDLARTAFLDQGGAVRAANKSPFTNIDSPTDFHLIAHANLAGGVKFVGDLVESNYLNYATLGLAPAAGSVPFAGSANPNGGALTTNLYQAELYVPVSQFGSKTTLELGRFKNQLGDLIYQRPDTDPYFKLPWYDDGNYVQDGFKLTTKFGSATTQLFAGSYTNLVGSNGTPLNTIYLGTYNSAGAVVTDIANQSAGLNIKLPIAKSAEIGLSILDFSDSGNTTAGAIRNEVIYGASLKFKAMGKLMISAEAAKSVTQATIVTGDGNSNDDDNAYKVNAAYASGALGLNLGYLYIDPRFSAPGAWEQIGSLYNPVNIQGPYAKASYKFSKKLTGTVGGAYYEGARDRQALGLPLDVLQSQGSSVGKLTAGMKYHFSKTVHVGADYEGDFWNQSTGARTSANQQFITLGAGFNLAGNTELKFGYQILSNLNNSGLYGNTPVGQSFDNANIFTTSVTVHF
jgi:hypothetical protein